MFMRDCTFLPSQNHGHGAAIAARPMAALPHLCTNFAAASLHGAECCRSGELKEQTDGERVNGFECGFQRRVAPIGARTAIEVAMHGRCEGRSGVFLREKRDLFTLTTRPFSLV